MSRNTKGKVRVLQATARQALGTPPKLVPRNKVRVTHKRRSKSAPIQTPPKLVPRNKVRVIHSSKARQACRYHEDTRKRTAKRGEMSQRTDRKTNSRHPV